ncbi:MAG TPA: hypothetical protein VN887_10370 [Candidatus Angelobacter sp.]|nr:hypothetical protein [Candidatus Angelobacter sp.]
MSEQQKAAELLAEARQYADMAISAFFQPEELDAEAIEELRSNLQAWFLFPNIAPEERALLARLGHARARLREAQSGVKAEPNAEREKDLKKKWEALKENLLYSGVMDSLTPLQREIVQRGFVCV